LDYSREFINVYIRSNLSLVLEEAENKSIIFASDFAGKDVLKDLKFEIYDQN
jgi:hypothetical protein